MKPIQLINQVLRTVLRRRYFAARDQALLRTGISLLVILWAAVWVVAQPSTDECADTKTKLTQAQTRLNDWPQLARYREANGKVTAPGNSEARVVFLGDSITDSWQNPRFGGFFPGKPYIDRGISGQTTPQMLVRFRADVIDLKPKAVVILAGTNDIAGNTGPMTLQMIEGNLMSMAELAKAHGIKVVLASVLPARAFPWRPEIEPAPKIAALNAWIRS